MSKLHHRPEIARVRKDFAVLGETSGPCVCVPTLLAMLTEDLPELRMHQSWAVKSQRGSSNDGRSPAGG